MEIHWKDIWWQKDTLNISDAALLLVGHNPDDPDTPFWARDQKVEGYTTVLRGIKEAIIKGDLPVAASFRLRIHNDQGEEVETEKINAFLTGVFTADLKRWATSVFSKTNDGKESDVQIVERMTNEGKDKIEIAEELLKHYPKITNFRLGKLLSPEEVFVEKGTIRKRGERLKKRVREALKKPAG